MQKELNWYLIDKNGSALFAEGNLVRGKNSKEALEKTIQKKVKRSKRYNDPFDYSVSLSNEKGHTWRDRRKTVYYIVVDN